MEAPAPIDERPLPVWLSIALAMVILTGLYLRIAMPGTTVFAADQARACALAEDISHRRWQAGGLINSGGFRNPPGYVYLLAAAWKVSPEPLSLLRFTQFANLLAFAISAWWVHQLIGKTAAVWAMAFFAASPWAIHYCRWIFAQHLLFPSALIVYICLWAWLVHGRRWAALGAMLGLILVAEIHLVGIILALAVGIVLIAWRPKLPLKPVALGVVIGIAALATYFLTRGGATTGGPDEERVGIVHIWRTIPAAAMSVSGIVWSLEFKEGYPLFAQFLGKLRWPLEIVMIVPVVLLATGFIISLSKTFRTGKGLVVLLVVAIPLAFVLAMLRTSPTYLPVWYPLPFILIGLAAKRFATHAWVSVALVCVLAAQLFFFTRQLTYIDRHGGVPHSVLGRSYAGLLQDRTIAAKEVQADEIWLQYAGETPIMKEAVPYFFRRGHWNTAPGRVELIVYRPPWEGQIEIKSLGARSEVPADAFQIRPWAGPQQQGARITPTSSADTTGK